MSSFNSVAERPEPFAKNTQPGVYLADPSRRLRSFLLDSILTVVTLGIGWIVWAIALNLKTPGVTPAKRIMRMRVVDAKTYAPLTLVQMILRRAIIGGIAGDAVILAAFLIGGLWNIFGSIILVAIVARYQIRNDRNRNVWDMASGSMVVFDKYDTMITPLADTPLEATSNILDLEGLNVTFATPRGNLKAVRDVSIQLPKGESLGVVGESGSGKTVLSRATMGLLPSTATRTGSIKFRGREISSLPAEEVRELWGLGMAMIFQDPMTALNPVRRIGDQLTESLTERIGMDRKAATERALQLLKRVRIPDPEGMLKKFPYQLSGGMRQRIMIAIAVSCEPEMLFADEPTTALDVTVQAQVLELLSELRKESDMSMILVTHDLGVVAGHTDRIAVMYAGDIVEYAPTRELFANMKMPYTEALLKSIPRLETPTGTRLPVIEGRFPDPTKDEPGCPFANRCTYVQDKCRTDKPPLTDGGNNHFYRCWFPIGGEK
jgi:peptide/nickel transport system ATP-binding protein